MRLRSFLLLSALMLPVSSVQAMSPGGPKVTPKARAVHERALTIDTHLDTPAFFGRKDWNFAEEHNLDTDPSQVDLPRMKKGGMDGGFLVIFTPQQARTPEGRVASRDRALTRAMEIRETAAKHPGLMELAYTAADAERIAATGKRFFWQSMENSDPLSSDITLLKTFYDWGLRMVGPVHFLNNDLADSSTDPKGPEWGGLSPLGRQLVKDANRMGVILDGSHASDAAFEQMIELSSAPVILSHTGCHEVFEHPRNVPDELLKKMAAEGGVIQINAYPDYVSKVVPNPERQAAMRALFAKYGPRDQWDKAKTAAFIAERKAIFAQFPQKEPTWDEFIAHLLHALKVVGPDHVGIGPDWDGGGGLEGLRDITDSPKITQALLDAGYSDADIAKIWGGNVIRLMKAVEAESARIKAGAAAAD